jgi:hypothetical protein
MALVATLLADGSHDAAEAARVIVNGLEKDVALVALTTAQATRSPACSKKPSPTNSPRCAALIRDFEQRTDVGSEATQMWRRNVRNRWRETCC